MFTNNLSEVEVRSVYHFEFQSKLKVGVKQQLNTCSKTIEFKKLESCNLYISGKTKLNVNCVLVNQTNETLSYI